MKHNASKSARAWKRDLERAQQLKEESESLTVQLEASLDALGVWNCRGGCGQRMDAKGQYCIRCYPRSTA